MTNLEICLQGNLESRKTFENRIAENKELLVKNLRCLADQLEKDNSTQYVSPMYCNNIRHLVENIAEFNRELARIDRERQLLNFIAK